MDLKLGDYIIIKGYRKDDSRESFFSDKHFNYLLNKPTRVSYIGNYSGDIYVSHPYFDLVPLTSDILFDKVEDSKDLPGHKIYKDRMNEFEKLIGGVKISNPKLYLKYLNPKMNLKESIRRILIEETNPIYSALRRVNFTEDTIINHLKRFSLRFLDEIRDTGLLMNKVFNFTSYELIEPGISHLSDEDADKAIDIMSKKLKDKYSDLIEDYVNKLISNDDNDTYCFKKHSDRYMNMKNNRGFGDCVEGWVNFMSKYGSWFPDLDWDEIKEKISSNPNIYMLIKKPLENHPYEYYFSVLKNDKR